MPGHIIFLAVSPNTGPSPSDALCLYRMCPLHHIVERLAILQAEPLQVCKSPTDPLDLLKGMIVLRHTSRRTYSPVSLFLSFCAPKVCNHADIDEAVAEVRSFNRTSRCRLHLQKSM